MKKFALLFLILLLTVPVFAADNVMFDYQGRVKVQGQSYDGTGYFKFAIVNNPGTTSLWSNDMTSENGGEPDTAITANVQEGIFNVTIGDPAVGMEPINRTVFNHPNKIKLRTWFSDGTHGFQQLLPDRKLNNVELMGMVSGNEDFTIYVDSINGDDENNGLTTETAKQHIQAAVDVLPAKLECNVTIDVADGVYREEALIVSINGVPGKGSLTINGDESWSPSSPSDPGVRITGMNTSGTVVRHYGVSVVESSQIFLRGLLMDNTHTGFNSGDANVRLYNCKSTDNVRGMICNKSTCRFYDCLSESNDQYGFIIIYNSFTQFIDCIAQTNSLSGIYIQTQSSANFYSSGDFSDNGENGIYVDKNSSAHFTDGYSGQINDNGDYGILVRYASNTINHGANSFSGNVDGPVYTEHGGQTYP